MENREILFRGQKSDSKEWVEGLLFFSHGTGEWKITTSNGWVPSYSNPDEGESTVYHNVDYKSVGQFTNLLNKDESKIFSGKIRLDIKGIGGGDAEIVIHEGCWMIYIESQGYLPLIKAIQRDDMTITQE